MFCRIKIILSNSTESIPFDNQSIVNGIIYRWLGKNGSKYHNTYSNYCISGLLGGYKVDNHIEVTEGYIIVSSIDINFIKELIQGIVKNRNFGWGMKVVNIEKINETINKGRNKFLCISGIYLVDENGRIITYKDENFEEVLNNQMKRKMSNVDNSVNLNGFKISLNRENNRDRYNKTKIITLNKFNKLNQPIQLHYPVSLVNLVIEGDLRAIELCYHLGLGMSTGSGFGVIAKSNINYKR